MDKEKLSETHGKALPEIQEEEVSIFRNKTFVFYLFSIIFTSLTTPMYMLIEGWYVADYLNMPTMLGIVIMVTAIPRLLLMSAGGVVSDRFRKSRIMFLSDFTRFLLLIIMAVLFAYKLLSFWVLIAFALVFGILEAFYWPAATSIIPTIVSKNQLRVANGINGMIQPLAMLIGPAIAMSLLALGSFQFAFIGLGVLLLLGSIFLFFVREKAPDRSETESKASMLREIKEGLQYIKQDSFKVSLLVSAGIASFFVAGPVSVALPTLVKSVYHGTALDLTYLQTAFAVGSILGGALLGAFRPKGNMAVWSFVAFILLCLGIVGLGWAPQLVYAIVISVFTGLFSSYANMLILTVYQSSLDQDKLGRGMSLFTITTMGLTPISTGLVPVFLNNGWTISNLLMVCGTITGVFLLIVLLSVKSIRSNPTSAKIQQDVEKRESEMKDFSS